MPTTFSDIVPVRRVAVGDCSGPLGSGFDALARSAYASLLRSGWTESADPPFLPVHDNGQTANKTIPRGDAWKCSYGYDADARTERSACGAVCYTFALPGDAYSGTPANISTVALSLTGDRYLDAGVDLYLVPSASPTPPTIQEILALTPVGTYCATSDQSPTPPNERHGVTAAVEATPGVAAQPYLHVALLLHDYTTNRGAWIEGGAMLEGAAATITFSREVAEDAPPDVRLLAVTTIGIIEGPYQLSNVKRAFGFLSLSYVTPTPQNVKALTTSDAMQLVRLAYDGRLVGLKSERSFIASTSYLGSSSIILYPSGSGGPKCLLTITPLAFYSSRLALGMEINVGTILNSGTAAAMFRVALVQHRSIANVDDSFVNCPIGDLPPIDQVANGDGPDIVAISPDMSVPSESGSAPGESSDVVLSVVREPTMPYLSLVIFPISGPTNGESASLSYGGFPEQMILVASMPTA